MATYIMRVSLRERTTQGDLGERFPLNLLYVETEIDLNQRVLKLNKEARESLYTFLKNRKDKLKFSIAEENIEKLLNEIKADVERVDLQKMSIQPINAYFNTEEDCFYLKADFIK